MTGDCHVRICGSRGLRCPRPPDLDALLDAPLATVAAYELALRFDDFYEIEDPDRAQEYLRRWIHDANASGENDALNWPHCDVLNWPHLSVRS